jgi:hypothetical protein
MMIEYEDVYLESVDGPYRYKFSRDADDMMHIIYQELDTFSNEWKDESKFYFPHMHLAEFIKVLTDKFCGADDPKLSLSKQELDAAKEAILKELPNILAKQFVLQQRYSDQ